MKTAIYPGSFDPVTLGHLAIIERAAKMFDIVRVVVVVNPSKHCIFTLEERMDMLRRVTARIPNIEVDCWSGLLVDYADQYEQPIVIRGLRALSDFESEFQMAHINHKLNPRVDTVFLAANEEHTYFSSSIVREIGSYGGDISGFIPAEILDEVAERTRCRT